MWRIDPESKVVVSVKRNPAAHTNAECGNRGYLNIKPRRSAAVPRLRPGDAHTLRAEMNGQELRVFVDGVQVNLFLPKVCSTIWRTATCLLTALRAMMPIAASIIFKVDFRTLLPPVSCVRASSPNQECHLAWATAGRDPSRICR